MKVTEIFIYVNNSSKLFLINIKFVIFNNDEFLDLIFLYL